MTVSDFHVIAGDAINELQKMPSESVHICVTSPPYWGLRDYKIEPSVWGELPRCEHVWDESAWSDKRHTPGAGAKQLTNAGSEGWRSEPRQSDTCHLCGAWRGALGLEPDPDLYVRHIVEVFRHVRRVLHKSGTLWLNLGDCYSSGTDSERVPSQNAGGNGYGKHGYWTNPNITHRVNVPGLAAKNLAMIPARVALALQADGWYLRSQIPWLKRNGMPESTPDRPTSMVEYIFLLAKSEGYYYDREAVRIQASVDSHARGDGVNPKARLMGPNSRMVRDQDPDHQTEAHIKAKQNRSFSAAVNALVSTRARRNTDWFFESWAEALAAPVIAQWAPFQGLLPDENGDPLAMLVNPQPFSLEMCAACQACYEQRDYRKLAKGDGGTRICACGARSWLSHFATFPERLVEPCILAGTSAHGACPDCGAPWERILERAPVGDWHPDPEHKHDAGAVAGTAKWAKEAAQSSGARAIANVAAARASGKRARDQAERNGDPVNSTALVPTHDQPFLPPRTLGWRPTCDHPLFPAGDPVPCVVLDPFAGSGRTGLAAVRLGRHFRGIDANPMYVKMALWQAGRRSQESEARSQEASA